MRFICVAGHASGTTTSIYVRAKDKRMAEEAGKYFSKNLPDEEVWQLGLP